MIREYFKPLQLHRSMTSSSETQLFLTTRSFVIALMLIMTTLSMAVPTVAAIGPNQNDIAMGMDLPDNSTTVSSSGATMMLNGYAPYSSNTSYGELDVGDDQDWFAISLNTNESITVQIEYNYTFTSSNGSTYYNDFELHLYNLDSAGNLFLLDSSITNNPEVVTTNSSTTPHSGTVYVKILRYDGYGTYALDVWTHTTSTSNGTGGNGTTNPTNCVGAGTLTTDILEPNDATSTATVASLPLLCTGLSIYSTGDYDYFEVVMLTGVTYYVNITFNGASGDIDTQWTSATGSYLASSGSTSSIESMTVFASSNQTTYVEVYGFSSATNVYDISITTDLPGGGQSFESIDVEFDNLTSATIRVDGLTVGQNYSISHSTFQEIMNGSMSYSNSTTISFTATNTSMMFNITMNQPNFVESVHSVSVLLQDVNGSPLNSGTDSTYIELVETSVSSSTTGEISMTNLTVGTDYFLEWIVVDETVFQNSLMAQNDVYTALNASQIDRNTTSWIAGSSSNNIQLTWNGPTTLNSHFLAAILSINNTVTNHSTSDGWIGFNDSMFIPQLPTLLIDSYSISSTSTTNDVMTKGYDLVIGDQYQYQIRITDSNGASFAASTLTAFNTSSTNMSMPMFTYTTPNASGTYCIYADLYSSVNVQLIGDSDCFNLIIDDDNDGVANEYDLCPNTTTGAAVDMDGCELSQKDSDGDGYNDLVDDFPSDASQYSDMDGDGFGDNPNGNSPDAFPLDSSQWTDQDGDGYGDNPNGNASDMFPYDQTQWADQDGDGYGDNPNGNYADEYPTDSTQWVDSDGDGYGDNSNGTNGDAFPNDPAEWMDSDGDGCGDNSDLFALDSTQCTDLDGDGYGDNPSGNNGDAFVNEPSQWSDQDNDGYGDNQAGNQPDAFPADGTQWADADGDGYGDNQNGNAADRFVDDVTQWFDDDNDGFGDNSNGNNPDSCLATPAGEVVDATGCSSSQLDDDLDGVTNNNDACPSTPAGQSVDSAGCSSSQEDSDNDGVNDAFDLCPGTPLGEIVDNAGCADEQLDGDQDGISDEIDQCPTTNPGALVNGVGCSSSERDSDGDGVVDIFDMCGQTPVIEVVNADGCSNSQLDDDKDLFTNDIDQCPNTELGVKVDTVGCAAEQYDDDNDLIDNTVDECPATPSGEQVDASGCSDSQLDQDNDSISDNLDLCPDTNEAHGVDFDGCSEHQKDDDGDGVMNINDECAFTAEGAILVQSGCSLDQLDSDGDGVNDAEDDFRYDRNESVDTDGDGVADTYDAYPDDAFRSEREAEGGGGTLIFGILALAMFSGIAALLVVRKNKDEDVSSPWATTNQVDQSTETHMHQQVSKELPAIGTESQQWEENGITWSKSANGELSYYDQTTSTWIPYE